MNSKSLTVLAVVTVLVGALAFWSLRWRGETPKTAGASTSLTSTTFLPSLASKANDTASITVQGSGKESIVKKVGENWVLASRGDYPVEVIKVKDAVQSLSDLLIFEPKTQDPSKFAQLGLDEPSNKPPSDKPDTGEAPDTPPRLVTLKDAQGGVLASVIVGSSATSMGRGAGQPMSYSVYVRRAGENQAYRAKGPRDPRATLDPDPMSWLKRDAIAVEAARVKGVTISHADGSRVVVGKAKKDDRDYKVEGVPADRELKFGGAAAPIAGALSFVNFDDVSPIADVAEGATPTGSAEFKTFDGMVVTVDTSTKGGTAWATFAARYEKPPDAEPVPSDQPPPTPPKSEADVRKEVQDINDRLSKWAFALPSFKVKQILTTMEDLLKPADQTPVKIDQGAKPPPPPATPEGQPKVDK